jgi:hypothetical protein
MCCPYFEPVNRVSGSGSRSDMLPLGDSWAGVCRAAGDRWQPDEYRQRHFCNLGYVRETCNRFPDDGGPDAVRFTVRTDDGRSVRIDYAVERDHHPFANGTVEFSLTAGSFTSAIQEHLRCQARAYVESYLRRKELQHGS